MGGHGPLSPPVSAALHLDEKLDFNAHIKRNTDKANREIGFISKLRSNLPRNALLTICKSFIRLYLDYGDIVYDQHINDSFGKELESVQ